MSHKYYIKVYALLVYSFYTHCQVDDEENIELSLNFLRLPCPAQYIKVRDGASLSSTLLAELSGGSNAKLPLELKSSGAQLLLEFYAGNDVGRAENSTAAAAAAVSENAAMAALNLACTGGFLANVVQLGKSV